MIDFFDLIQQAIKHDLWGVLFLAIYHFAFVRPWIKEVKAKNAGYQRLVQEKLGNIEDSIKDIKSDLQKIIFTKE